MTTWNHRVVRFKSDHELYDDHLAICEVFYNPVGKPVSHTSFGVTVTGDTVEELRITLERMLQCLDKPIIEDMGRDKE